MTDKQPEALRLADVLREEGESWWDYAAAAELRLQHSQIEYLSGLVAEKNKMIAELIHIFRRIRFEQGFACECGIENAKWDLIEKAIGKNNDQIHD